LEISIYSSDLVKKYRQRTVVNHVSIEVKQGEIVGLLGPNGAGKTTTFYMVVGLIKPDEGEVYLNDMNITKLPMYKRAQLGIGYLPQEASVFRKLTVEENISAVLEMTRLPKKEQKEKLESLLDEFRLHHVRKSNGDVLSGGERRRTEIARALAVDPKFILLDEPFAGIDPIAVEDIQAIVAKLKFKNIGILITDHNVTETLSICDRTAEELGIDEQVKKLYLGRNFELKRKDWLLKETPKEAVRKTPELDHLFHSLEEALLFFKMVEDNEKALQSTDGAGMTGADLQLMDDLARYITEVDITLTRYATESNNTELLIKAKQLRQGETLVDAHENLKSIYDTLKSIKEE
jgi:lipopolysaccharide export system ATP-binding protein